MLVCLAVCSAGTCLQTWDPRQDIFDTVPIQGSKFRCLLTYRSGDALFFYQARSAPIAPTGPSTAPGAVAKTRTITSRTGVTSDIRRGRTRGKRERYSAWIRSNGRARSSVLAEHSPLLAYMWYRLRRKCLALACRIPMCAAYSLPRACMLTKRIIMPVAEKESAGADGVHRVY